MKKRLTLVVGTLGLLVLVTAGVTFTMVIAGTHGPDARVGANQYTA